MNSPRFAGKIWTPCLSIYTGFELFLHWGWVIFRHNLKRSIDIWIWIDITSSESTLGLLCNRMLRLVNKKVQNNIRNCMEICKFLKYNNLKLVIIDHFSYSLTPMPSIESVILDESKHIQGIPRADSGESSLSFFHPVRNYKRCVKTEGRVTESWS